MPSVYVASKVKHSHWWRALRAAGVPISATWVDAELNEAGADEPTTDVWRVHWDKCVTEALEADVPGFMPSGGRGRTAGRTRFHSSLWENKREGDHFVPSGISLRPPRN